MSSMHSTHSRRRFLAACAALAAGEFATLPANAAEPPPRAARRVVILGGGFGGATAAKYLRLLDSSLDVVLVERDAAYLSCPFSNLVLGGTFEIDRLTVSWQDLQRRWGVRVVRGTARAIDAQAGRLILEDGEIGYERLIVAPGIDFRTEEIEGYDRALTPGLMPHAWHGADQLRLLQRQLREMPDGGTVVICVPLGDYRCPPGPYERACQIAWYLRQAKPRSKLLLLDANADIVAKGTLFRQAWERYYRSMIEYRPGHRIVRVDNARRRVDAEVEEIGADVISLIPPQRAGALALESGLAGRERRWCAVDQVTFESAVLPRVHVIGDACAAGAMPKSAFAANSQAKALAQNLVASLRGEPPLAPSQSNVCYSMVTDREAVSVAAVYRVNAGRTEAVPRAGGVSARISQVEGRHARSWLDNILADSFE